MADLTGAGQIRTGLSSLMQDHLSPKLINTLSNRMPLVAFLLMKDGNKRGFTGLGRPGTGVLVSGSAIARARKEQILNSRQYMPIIQTSLPPASDGKVATMYDTMPTRTGWTTNTPASRFKRPFFRWVERIDPISVPNKEIRRTKAAAPNEKAANVAVGDLFRFEADSVLQTHMQWWNTQLWGTGASIAPSDETAEVWDGLHSIQSACKDNNIYGGIDRSLPTNAWWRGKFITATRAAVLEDLVNEANYTLGLSKKGQGLNLMLCGASLFPRFASEAKAKGGTVFYDGLPKMLEFGVKLDRPVIQYNETYIIYDPECPDVLHEKGTYTKNAVAGLNLDTWTLAINPDANFTVTNEFDQSKVKGGTDETTAYIRTEIILACEVPSFNVYWEDVK